MSETSILIMDFDFFSSIGGGQVFYRRVVERNPYAEFYYPSRGKDFKMKQQGLLPPNAHPFLFSDLKLEQFRSLPRENLHWTSVHYMQLVLGVAVALQGRTFNVVDFPSFFPALHVARSVFSAFGITVERMAVAFLGWGSVSSRMGYSSEQNHGVTSALEIAEKAAVDCADIRYTISDIDLHQEWDVSLPIASVDMHDTLEEIVPRPVGKSRALPDLWFVGRLDGAKGPDIFLDIVSRVPRALYGRCCFTGPDNDWHPGERWSGHLLKLAASLGIDAEYFGQLSDSELRERVFGGRCVVIIPSRTDTFNYVALEAVRSGCLTLLSNRTGASAFLSANHPKIAPLSIDPDDVIDASWKLAELLTSYDRELGKFRAALERHPLPLPRKNFMRPVYESEPCTAAHARKETIKLTQSLTDTYLLMHPVVVGSRPARRKGARASIVIPTYNRPQFLLQTLTSLSHQTFEEMECIVVDDGSQERDLVEEIVAGFNPWARLVRTENNGEAAAVNRGILEATGGIIGFLSDDDVYHPDLVAESISVMDTETDIVGTYPDWNIIDVSGYFVETHRLPDFDIDLLLKAHWCLPGVGAFVRRPVARKIGGRDTSFRWVSDFDFWSRVCLHGKMAHIPHVRGYWRLHENAATNSRSRLAMAEERIRLARKFSQRPDLTEVERNRIIAAGHLAASAIIARTDDAAALHHLGATLQLDASLVRNLPENMKGYPALWPPEMFSMLDLMDLKQSQRKSA